MHPGKPWSGVGRAYFTGQLLIIAAIAVTASSAVAQPRFGRDRRVNDDAPGSAVRSTESSGQHNLIAIGDSVYLAWGDGRGGAYFARSTDRGMTFGPNSPVSDVNAGWYPAMAALADGHIVMVWEDTRDDSLNPHIYVDRSLDGGRTFGVDHAISATFPTGTKQRQPAIAMDSGGTIYVAWFDDRYGPMGAIVCARSRDGGGSFEAPVLITDGYTNPPRKPALAMGPHGEVYIAWYEHGPGADDSRCSVSVDAGLTFSPSVHAIWGWAPSIATGPGGDVHITASHSPSPYEYRLGAVTSVDGGVHFGPEVVVGTSTAGAISSVAVTPGGQVFVVWNFEIVPCDIWVAASGDGGTTFGDPEQIADERSLYPEYPALAITPGGRPLVAWTDWRAMVTYHADIYIDGQPSPVSSPRIALAATSTATTRAIPASSWSLENAQPSPFNPATTIRFTVAQEAEVTLRVFDVGGRTVATLVKGQVTAGPHAITWDGRVSNGERAARGVYFYRLEAPGFVDTRRMIVMK